MNLSSKTLYNSYVGENSSLLYISKSSNNSINDHSPLSNTSNSFKNSTICLFDSCFG